MEFPQSLSPLFSHPSLLPSSLHVDGPHIISVWHWSTLERLRDRHLMNDIFLPAIALLGSASASAQQLKQVITTPARFTHSRDRIYLHVTLPNTLNGLLRIGEKRLFLRDESRTADMIEGSPKCVLDFYVNEKRQRSGIGKALFERMIEWETSFSPAGTPPIVPASLAYDRPSSKLLSFLSKHYGLTKYSTQTNNFVVFRDYFPLLIRQQVVDMEEHQEAKREMRVAQHKRTKSTAMDVATAASEEVKLSSAAAPGFGRQRFHTIVDNNNSSSSSSSGGGGSPFTSPHKSDASLSLLKDLDNGTTSSIDQRRHARGASFSPTHHHQQQPVPPFSVQSGQQSNYSAHAVAVAQSLVEEAESRYAQQQQQQQQPSSSSNNNHNSTININNYNNNGTTQRSRDRQPFTSAGNNILQPPPSSSSSPTNLTPRTRTAAPFAPYGTNYDPVVDLSVDRSRVARSGLAPRPLHDPVGPAVMSQHDRSIRSLEESIQQKVATLAAVQRYELPYRQPNSADSSWSKAAIHQRVANGANSTAPTDVQQYQQLQHQYQHDGSRSNMSLSMVDHSSPTAADRQQQSALSPSSYNRAPPAVSSADASYADPSTSTLIGGGRAPYTNPAMHAIMQPRSRVPFAYGVRGAQQQQQQQQQYESQMQQQQQQQQQYQLQQQQQQQYQQQPAAGGPSGPGPRRG